MDGCGICVRKNSFSDCQAGKASGHHALPPRVEWLLLGHVGPGEGQVLTDHVGPGGRELRDRAQGAGRPLPVVLLLLPQPHQQGEGEGVRGKSACLVFRLGVQKRVCLCHLSLSLWYSLPLQV